MTIFKRAVAVTMAAVLAAGTLSGCGGEKNPAVTADGKIRLTVSNWPDSEADPKGYENKMDLKRRFEEKYTDIEIVPDYYTYDTQTFAAKAEGGTLPVLYATHFTEAKKIMDLGYAADLTDKMKEYGYYELVDEAIMNEITRDGKVYFVPNSAYSLGLVINLNLFREAGLINSDGSPIFPKTFDEVRAMAKTVHEKTGKAGFVFPTTGNGGGWNFTALAWNFGGTFMKEVDGKYEADFNEGTTNALQWLKDLMWEDGSLPSTTLVTNDDTMKLVGTDQAAMALAHPGQVGLLVSSYGMEKNDIGYAAMPAGESGEPVTLMGGDYWGMASNATDEQKDAAFKWLQFIGATPASELTEETKESLRSTYEKRYETGNSIIGVKDLTVWTDKEATQAYKNQLVEEFRNIDEKNIISYNNKSGMKYKTEEKMNAQDLYSILDSCIQEVLTNKESECAAVLEEAEAKFQNNYLNN